MNTGLHDGWNLDFFLNGHGNEQLLDSYTAERISIIKDVVETTDHLTKVMGTPNKFALALPDAVIPMVSRLAPFQRAFVQRLFELGIAYRGSPIAAGRFWLPRQSPDNWPDGCRHRSHFLASASAIRNLLDSKPPAV